MAAYPSISQYLISTCLYIINEFNEKYEGYSNEELKAIADTQFNEMDLTVRIGYPFRHMVHYTVGDGKSEIKNNHDLYIKSKDFRIEIKFLKNWKAKTGHYSNSKNWNEFEEDFYWLLDEIDGGHKDKRAFIIGWFNCVDCFSSIIKLGSGKGRNSLLNEARFCFFPFLQRTKTPTRIHDITYKYGNAYQRIPYNPIGNRKGQYDCIFIGNENDKFHFAIYY